ncbi:MAG: RND family transporter [Novosphingobium sp.]|nr:RND family transporter [Novosphingobium sp.]
MDDLRDRIAHALVTRPFLCLLAVVAIILATAPGLPSLKIDSSARSLVVEDDPATRDYERMVETFGNDLAFSVIYRSDALFTPAVLASIDEVTLGLEDLDGVTRVVSLATVNGLQGDGKTLDTDLLMPVPPASDAEAQAIGKRAMANELLVGEVVGRSGRAAQVTAFIEQRPEDRDFERRTLASIEAILDRERDRLGPSVTIYVSGPPVVSVAMVDTMVSDLMTLAPLAIIAVVLIYFWFFRTAIVVVLPIVSGFASVLATLGFMGLMGFELNPLSIIIPPMLLVVGATEDIHLLSEYVDEIDRGQDKAAATGAMLRYCLMPVFLTSLTTTIGFLTLSFNEIPLISEFGIAASFGMAINLVMTLLATPAIVRLMPVPVRRQPTPERLASPVRHKLAMFVTGHSRLIAIVGLGVFLAGSALAMRVTIDNDFLSFFDDDAPILAKLRDQSRDVSGAAILVVQIDTHKVDGLQEPETLAAVAKLSDYLAGRHDDVMGYDLFIRRIHQQLNAGQEDYFAIPDSPALIAQYSLLIDPETLSRFADFDMSKGLLLVRTRIAGSNAMTQELATIREYAEGILPPGVDVTFSGSEVLVARSGERVSREVLANLASVYAAVFVILLMIFASLRLAAISIVPNLFPTIAVFGAMVMLGIPLDTAVFPVAVIALGIAVDDTIHFISRHIANRRAGESREASVRETVEREFRPIVTSSVALIGGFSIMTFAAFGSIQQFGILAAIAIFVALAADLLITPALVLLFDTTKSG